MEKQKMVYKRTCVLALLLLAMFGSTCFRLSDFQVVRGEELLKKAQNEVITVKTVPAARGTITDRYGRVLAASETSFRLILDCTFLEKGNEFGIIPINENFIRGGYFLEAGLSFGVEGGKNSVF